MKHHKHIATFAFLALLAVPALAMASDPEIGWRVEIDGIVGVPPAIGPNGEIVAQSFELLVIEPDGSVRWRNDLPVTGFDRLCDVDDQGRIYATSVDGLHSFDADGNLLWTALTNDDNVLRPHAGPTVGPDGNIYVLDITDLAVDGLGFASVNPDGDVRWTYPDEAWGLASMGAPRRDIAFADGKALVSSEGMPGGDEGPGLFSGVKAFTLDGEVAWTTVLNTPNWVTPSQSDKLFVPVDPLTIRLLDVSDGSATQFPLTPSPNVILNRVAADDDGIGYSAEFPSAVRRLTPSGTSSILASDFGAPMSPPAVSPDGSLIVLGTAPSVLPSLNRLTGIDAETGDVLFTIPIEPDEGEPFPAATGIPQFSADGRFVYMGVTATNTSWIYAFDLDPDAGGSNPADLNDDDVVNTADLLILLSAWGACDECAEDIDGDGTVGTEDLLMLLANWG